MLSCSDAPQSDVWLHDGPRDGCVDGEREEQRHGTACLCCHANEFGVAGSVDRAGPIVARVVVSDEAGRIADMVPNGFGNFFRHLKLTPPLSAVVYGELGTPVAMKSAAPSGDCNACHGPGKSASAIRGPVE